jgi:hypothetical protein
VKVVRDENRNCGHYIISAVDVVVAGAAYHLWWDRHDVLDDAGGGWCGDSRK